MGQVATLTRINKETFDEMEESEEFPHVFETRVDVDKDWEAIMYILGNGFLGKEPTVNLFMPKNIIVQYEDKYMTTGIRYHDKIDICELWGVLENVDEEELIENLDLQKMNKKIMYPSDVRDLVHIKKGIAEIKTMFSEALKEDSIIIATIG